MTLKNILARLLVWTGLSRQIKRTVVKIAMPDASIIGRNVFRHTGYASHIQAMQPGDELTFVCDKPEMMPKFRGSVAGYAGYTFGSGSVISRSNKLLGSVSIIRVR